MVQLITKARPRRGANRITLVNIDGTPVCRPDRDHALAWPPSVDDWFWECGESPADLAAHVSLPPVVEPDDDGRRDGSALWAELMIESSLPLVETDAEFLARLDAAEAAERARVLGAYPVLPEDLAELAAWSEPIGAYRGVSSDELAHLAAHGCV